MVRKIKKSGKTKKTLKRSLKNTQKIEKPKGALNMLETALEMEMKGQDFYKKAVDSCHDKLGKEMFNFLLHEEVVHVKRIRMIFEDIKQGRDLTNGWKSVSPRANGLESFFGDLITKHSSKSDVCTDDIKALDVGIDFETKAIKFYTQELLLTKNDLMKEFVQMMMLEEQKHLEILEDMKMYLVDPEGWNAKIDRLDFSGVSEG